MSDKRLVIAIVATFAFGGVLFAQTAELTGESLLRALLVELRSFRTSMQKNSAYELRGRLLIDRARLHQETIRELAREVEGNAEMLRSSDTIDFTADMESEMEARVGGIANPEERRKAMERQKQAMERRREMHARHMEQTRMRFQRMENRLAEEREKLRAIEDELAQIQRELIAASG